MRAVAAASLIACVYLLACGSRSNDAMGPERPTPSAPSAQSTPKAIVDLKGYPWARLRVAGNPLEALDLPFDRAKLTELGVKQYTAYTATTPRVWLLVFEFEEQSTLLAAEAKINALLVEDRAPYYRKSAHTGPWLLLTGFPSEKPVSPEMESARGEFLQRWWGEE
jgi:hypothetical protein